MNTKTNLFDIYFSGKLMPDANIIYARSKIAAMFKANEQQLNKLFSKEPTAIKRNVDMEKAIKYRLAFRDAGALIDIKPANMADPVAKKVSEPVPPVPVDEPEEIVITSVAEPAEEEIVITAPVVTANEDDLAQPAEDPESAIATLSLDHLSLAPVGSDVADQVEVEEKEFNTDEFEVLPANEGTLKYFSIEKEPVEIPDISHLTAEKPNPFE